jgi:hypothetical protein
MPRSGPVLPNAPQTGADLRRRAARLRAIAREFPDDEIAGKLLALAAELDNRADAVERPIEPGVADP